MRLPSAGLASHDVCVERQFGKPDPSVSFSDAEWALLLNLRDTGHKREAVRATGLPEKTANQILANVAEKLRLLASV